MSNEILSSQDYEAIEAAVMETERGRWFLREYAARNRVAEAAPIIEILHRIEARLAAPALPAPTAHDDEKIPPAITLAIADEQPARPSADRLMIRQLIAHARSEMQALREEAAHNGRTLREGDDFDAITAASDHAINSVLNATERIQELSWVLRERGMDAKSCDELDQRASEIYLACSFQDMTSRRLSALVETLAQIDAQVAEALSDDTAEASQPHTVTERKEATVPPSVMTPRPHADAREAPAANIAAALPKPETTAAPIHDHAKPSVQLAVPSKEPVVSRPALRHVGNLALSAQEDILEQARPALPAGIDYGELSFSEKIALFS